jgi:hypothetical protein
MPAKRKTTPPPSLAALSRQTGITRESLRKWKSEGVNIDDPTELAKRIEAMRKNAVPGSLSDAKLRKTLLECERIQLALDTEKGRYFPKEDVLALIRALDHFCVLVWKRLGRELAPILDGVPTPKIEPTVNGYIDNDVIPRFRQLLMDAKIISGKDLDEL